VTNTDGRAAWNILFAQLFWLVVADSELFILLRNRCLLIGAIFLFLFLVILQLKFLFISASRDWTNNNNSAVISSRFSKKKKPFASHRPSLSARNVVVCTRLLCLCVRFCLCLLLARSNCRHRRCCCWGFSFPRTSKQLVVVVVVVVGPFCLQTTHVAWAEERSGAQTARFFSFQRLSALKTRPCLLLSFETEIWLFLYLIFSRVQLFMSSPQLRRRIVRSGWQWRATGVSQSFAIFVVDMWLEALRRRWLCSWLSHAFFIAFAVAVVVIIIIFRKPTDRVKKNRFLAHHRRRHRFSK